ncbi:MAG: Na/Pi cotransporter family protein [Bdellovibrionales bacterium]|jgi:phosphate:Na+ symporter|nr:Na/Pi cotransporter family protein [Bdellovibrionales bacterium]
MEAFKLIYSVLGGLGVFFYGMKTMSEALQSAAGDVIKNAINIITKNRFTSVAVGTVITMIVQSSSVTTVMVVGFVNAGLMNLTQAIGVIFGANIGTTITGWIISIKVSKYGLLFIGIGIFPLMFGKTNKVRQIGRVLFGVGMIFFGLKIMSGAFKPLRTMPEFLEAISYFSGQHYGSYFASIIVGCLLTMIIQSSSAMLGITIAMALSGVIQFHTAVALVLGENIGTTITALLASVGTNVNAKRAARAHAIFNMLGVCVIFSIFPYYIEFIDGLVPGDPNFVNASGEFSNIAVHIASGHTFFNVLATLIFIPLLNPLSRIVVKITPDKNTKEQHHLVMLGDTRDLIPATALSQVRAEINRMKGLVDKCFVLVRDLLEGNVKSKTETVSKIRDYETIIDNQQKEITLFIVKLMTSPLSAEESAEGQTYMKVADELESVSDYLERITLYTRRDDFKDVLVGEAKEDFFKFFNEVEAFYEESSEGLMELGSIDLSVIHRKSEELRQKAARIRKRHLLRVSENVYKPLTALTYSDLIVALRKIRAHSENISEAQHIE